MRRLAGAGRRTERFADAFSAVMSHRLVNKIEIRCARAGLTELVDEVTPGLVIGAIRAEEGLVAAG
jgi:hypothetical protein